VSPPDPKVVADTVVLRYFLAVERTELLIELADGPVLVPTTVFDPEDQHAPEPTQSELRRGIAYHRRRAEDPSQQPETRQEAALLADRLDHMDALCESAVSVTPMTDAERSLFARLVDRESARELGLLFVLHPGEAACVAIAVERELTLVTDDSDALKAYKQLRSDGPYLRIRSLLRLAVDRGLIDRIEANSIHANMRHAGFWDTGVPFDTP